MKRVIRLGDPHTHGGTVITAATNTIINGKRVARQGDKAVCPKKGHGVVTIVEGDPSWSVEGRPVALEGHKCSCGCSLISTLPTLGRSYEGAGEVQMSAVSGAVAVVASGFASKQEQQNDSERYNELFALVDENGEPVPSFRYQVVLANGQRISGITDAQGRTSRIATGSVPMKIEFQRST